MPCAVGCREALLGIPLSLVAGQDRSAWLLMLQTWIPTTEMIRLAVDVTKNVAFVNWDLRSGFWVPEWVHGVPRVMSVSGRGDILLKIWLSTTDTCLVTDVTSRNFHNWDMSCYCYKSNWISTTETCLVTDVTSRNFHNWDMSCYCYKSKCPQLRHVLLLMLQVEISTAETCFATVTSRNFHKWDMCYGYWRYKSKFPQLKHVLLLMLQVKISTTDWDTSC